MPMHTIHDIAPRSNGGGALLVMLPGAMHRPQDLVDQGFIEALRERELPVDVAVADVDVGYYLERNVVERLSTEVIAGARARGYRKLWLMGISLGGIGALMYARAHAGEVEGVIVLAPYLGVPGLIEEVARAGGLDTWQPGEITAHDDERRVLAWVKGYDAANAALPRIHLGYGLEDRFAPASILLRHRLPPHHVVTIAGGHDWATWKALWRLLLDRGIFSHA